MNANVQINRKEQFMTNTAFTLEEVFKSKAKFEEFMNESALPNPIEEVMKNYPRLPLVRIADLTQNFETYLNTVGSEDFDTGKDQYLIWTVTSEKEKFVKAMQTINNKGTKGLNVFIFKASLNEDKTVFECLLKPELKKQRVTNKNTDAKLLQKELWQQYIDECDNSEHPELQIKEALPQHYQYVPINRKYVQLALNILVDENCITADISIPSKKEVYEELLIHKEEIEKKVGELIWYNKEGIKATKIRKEFPIDLTNPKNYEKAIKKLIEIGAEMTTVAEDYLEE